MNTSMQAEVSFSHQPRGQFIHRGGVVPDATMFRMSDVLALLGLEAEPWAGACPVRLSRIRGGALFYSEGAAAQALYVVRHGFFKCVKMSEDGYEHVLGFAGPGEVIGLEGLACDCQPLSAIALEDSSVLALPLVEFEVWRRQSPALDRVLQRVLSAQLTRARETAGMMAAVAAEVRLARFLVWMSERVVARGHSPRRFVLRMSRRDIASLLAVAHETVSRCFGVLAERGYVKVENREVEILDMAGLRASTRCTRRDMDEGALVIHERPAQPRVSRSSHAPA